MKRRRSCAPRSTRCRRSWTRSLRRQMQLEIEREALKKESDAASRERLKKIEKELAELKTGTASLKAQWQADQEALKKQRELRAQIEQVKTEIEQAERAYDLNKAAELKYGKLTSSRKAAGEAVASTTTLLKEEVDEEDIAQVVSRWTGIPLSKLLEGEVQKLLHLPEELHKRVIGQDEAVRRGGRRGDARARRIERSEAADRQLPVPGTDRRRKNRTGAGAGAIPVRRRAGDDPHRHVGVSGKAHGFAPGGRASGLHRLRRRRPVDRSRAAAALLGGAAGRNREGASAMCSMCCCRFWTTGG